MSFVQRLEALHGLVSLDLNLTQDVKETVRKLRQSIDDIVFDITKNELNFSEQKMLYDV